MITWCAIIYIKKKCIVNLSYIKKWRDVYFSELTNLALFYYLYLNYKNKLKYRYIVYTRLLFLDIKFNFIS
jgi:hypothetical protein